MNKHFMKSLRDNMPESLKYITSTFMRNKLIKNKEFCKLYESLGNREGYSPERIKEFQLTGLKNILLHSYQNVPYYSDLFNKIQFNPEELKSFDDIKIIPYLTKDIIRENFNKLISVKKVKGGCYTTNTSGSTGEPLKMLLDYDSFFKENAFIYYYRKKLGYQFGDKLVTFRGVNFGEKYWRFNPINNETIFSPFKLSKKTLEIYLKKINAIKPSYFNGYFSSIYFFAKLLSESNQSLSFRLKGIFLSSENINEAERLFVEDFFKVKTLTFYGHTERCVIAQEFAHNEYSFDPYYGYTEQIKTKDNSYEIVGTGFLNETMPLIRYKTDDICLDTNKDTVTIAGRRNINDYLIGINDEKISNSSLHFLGDILGAVSKYQFIQEKKGDAVLLLVPDKNFIMSELALIRKEIDKKMRGIINFEIKLDEKVVLTSRGKFQMFITNNSNN
jgi:phenylacetate-CoA ligase